MKPFFTFRAPNTQRWHAHPKGKKRYRIHAWVKLPISGTKLSHDVCPKQSVTVSDLMPIINNAVNELMDPLRNELFEHWAKFLLSINDETTDEDVDIFHDSFPESDYGIECYVWG